MYVCDDGLAERLLNNSQDKVMSFEVLEGASELIIMITHSQDVKKACSHVRACVRIQDEIKQSKVTSKQNKERERKREQLPRVRCI